LRKVYPYYFTFTTFTKGRWVGEKILDVFAREFRAHPVEEYERCIKSGSLTVNYEKVDIDYRLKHNDLLANIVHRHERPVIGDAVSIVHLDDDLVVVHKPPSVPVSCHSSLMMFLCCCRCC
ncbi:RNA pseudouridylate synthase domain-containing protein 2, partial [Daphnia magna]